MTPGDLLDAARTIDSERASALETDLGTTDARAFGVLLGTAFPPLVPRLRWQLDALDRIVREDWTMPVHHAEIVTDLLAAAGDLTDYDAAASGLRRAVWRHKARIALRELLPPELGGADVDITSRELTVLAEAAIDVALAEATSTVSSRLGDPTRADGERSTMVTLGMGKLGGRELNAGSDVDLIFLYDSDEDGPGVELHDYWTRVTRRAVRMLEEQSADPFVWRVDLRLRPEGSRGPIVNSVGAAERYYETWGRLWERSAMLRARPIAGDRELGDLVQREVITPFVFRREVDPTVATSLAELVQRSRTELSEDPERDLKLGRGGIREAEFFVQALQLIWGGREPSLRVRRTLLALERLKGRGLVSDQEDRDVTSAYLLLRRLEHRVQWSTGIQTHLLPDDDEAVGRIARSMGYSGTDAMLDELRRARDVVADRFASLAPTTPRPVPRYQSILGALDRDDDEALRHAVDAAFGADLAEHVDALARRPDSLLGRVTLDRYPDLGDQLLDAVHESADPELAVRYLRSFFGRFVSPAAYVQRVAEDERAMQRLVTVFGASAFVGEAVVSRPDLIDVVLFGTGGVTLDDARETVELELDTFERTGRDADDPDERRHSFVGALRRAKGKMMVAVAVADLAGEVETRGATRALSRLADETLERTIRFEYGEHGLVIVAVGKLGGEAIGYGSDLDVLFIYDPDAAPPGRDPAEFFSRKAQRIIRLISMPHPAGPGYELDTRLRPSGSQGLLVTSLEAFARYHGLRPDAESSHSMRPAVLSSGAAWERQALLRARPCAGDHDLGERFMAVANRAAYEQGAPPATELHDLRMRMERELGRERDGRWDLKTGAGGLLDVEFAVQWLQMRHGTDPRVRTPDTREALRRLVELELLDVHDHDVLREGYLFLRRLEQRIHVLNGTGSSVIDVAQPGLPQLARRMDLRDTPRMTAAEALLARYASVTRAVRQAYLRILGVAPEAEA